MTLPAKDVHAIAKAVVDALNKDKHVSVKLPMFVDSLPGKFYFRNVVRIAIKGATTGVCAMKDLEGNERPIRKLSTGADSTLGNWIDLSSAVFGPDSHATKFLQDKAATDPDREQGVVIADERQLLLVLAQLAEKDKS